MDASYIFTFQRLGFRNWLQDDVAAMAKINADPDVMEFFPAIKSYQETEQFIVRMQKQLADKGYCYFAVDKLIDGSFIGFIGLSMQTYEAQFNPCVDIGWRLCKAEWNKGYATEGARRCLHYAFEALGIEKVVATAPAINHRSITIMQKIGMHKTGNFIHPLLMDDKRLRQCVVYETSTVKQNRVTLL
jgi:RimJ/RimL family protein N-acetyltransferase